MECQYEDNTYGTIRKRKGTKAQPVIVNLNRSNASTNVGSSSPASTPQKRQKPLPKTPADLGKENSNNNTPISCSKLSSEDMRKVLPNSPSTTSPSHVLSPKQRRISKERRGSKGKRSMSPKPPVRPKTWTMSDRFDPTLILEKEAAVKDAEYVLGVISEYQKRVMQLPSDRTEARCDQVTRLKVVSQIDNDANIIAKTLAPLSGVTVTPDTPSKKLAPTIDENDEAAQLENKLFMVAKKLIDVKAVIEKTESAKRTAVMAKIVNAIKTYLSTGEMPTQLPKIPIEMAISLINPNTASDNILEEMKENTYRSGFLKKQGRKMKILRKRWCAMNHYQFQIFDSSRTAKKSISLESITSITCLFVAKEGYYHMILTTAAKKTTLCSKNRIEMAKWVLTLDSMIRPDFTSIITSPNPDGVDERTLSKEQLLSLLYKEPFGSGKMTSETYEEFWQYNGATGTLSNSKWGDAIEYMWDGSTLAPSKMSQMSLGTGKWNGVWLAWYTEKNEPFLKYYYSAGDRKYLASHKQPVLTWQWALNQLVGEGGEWICDGNIPHPVVMFLQMMRYYRLGR